MTSTLTDFSQKFIWENFKVIVTCHGINIEVTITTEV